MPTSKNDKIEYIKSITSITLTKYLKIYNVDRKNFNKGLVSESKINKIFDAVLQDIKMMNHSGDLIKNNDNEEEENYDE